MKQSNRFCFRCRMFDNEEKIGNIFSDAPDKEKEEKVLVEMREELYK